MENIADKFEHIYQHLSSKSFLRMEALGGEIPFFISAYQANKENEVQDAIKKIMRKLDANGIVVLEINLYNIACDILEDKGGVERMFKVEKSKNKAKFLKALQSTLNIHEVLMPRIRTLIDESEAHVYFITGIGLVYPYIRSHNILNNLQNVAKKAPTLMFFPGDYNGHSLKLFGMLKDDNYYRAFNIEKIEVQS